MKTHYAPHLMPDDAEQGPCGTWLGETSNLSGEWGLVDCAHCRKQKDKIIRNVDAEERAIVDQMGDMAAFMSRQQEGGSHG